MAIVSDKAQTTRNRIYGVVTRGEDSVRLPGHPRPPQGPANRLGDYMVDVVKKSVADVDAVLLLVEPIPQRGQTRGRSSSPRSKPCTCPAVLVINKIDTVDKPQPAGGDGCLPPGP